MAQPELPGHPARSRLATALPAVLVGSAALALWLAIRGSVLAGRGGWVPLTGWVIATLLLAGVAAIVAAAGARARPWLAVCLLADTVGLLLMLAWADSGRLRLLQVGELYLLMLGWLLFLAVLVRGLRRWGPGAAVAGGSVVFLLQLAIPVALTPMLRALPEAGQERLLLAAGYVSPTLPVVECVLHADWPHRPLMYAWTPVGQSLPMPLGLAWWNPLVGQAGVLLLAGLAARGRRRRSGGS